MWRSGRSASSASSAAACRLEATYFGSVGRDTCAGCMSYNNPEPSQLAEHQQRAAVPEVRQHPGDERARVSSHYHALYLKLQRRFSRGVELPQLVLAWQVDRQRQRDPHDGWRLS